MNSIFFSLVELGERDFFFPTELFKIVKIFFFEAGQNQGLFEVCVWCASEKK